MRMMKKLFAIALVAAMVMALGVTALADEDGYTVTINQNEQDKGTHEYGAWQVFKGNLDDNTGAIGDIQWGDGITDAGKAALGNAADYAAGITEENAAEKAAEIAQYLTNAPEQTGVNEIAGLDGGYYLIKDTKAPEGNPSAQTKYILKVVRDTEVTVKSSVPTVEKKVQEKNDTTGTTSNWQDAADYDIGDSIPYQVTATIGSGIDNFKSYSLQFVDSMSKGLTLEDGWTITVDDVDVTSYFTYTSASGENGYTVHTWAINDLKSVATLNENSKVVLSYTAILNDNAVIGAAGNPNTVVLKYDNNPNDSGKGTPGGTTPEDKNIVFTYELVANKVDSEGQALNGAGFTLYKKVGSDWVQQGDEITDVTTFNFSGKDAGAYKLVESTVPAGYNQAADLFFLVEGTYDTVSDNPSLTALDVYASDESGVKGAKITEGSSVVFNIDLDKGTATTNVVNQQGAELPSTGGIGTKIFYGVGAVLVIGAGVVLMGRKRAAD